MIIFISYSSKNRELVIQLADKLSEMGYEVRYDQQIQAGQAWWDKILEDIRSCDVFIYALSPEYVDSYPCDLEYHYAKALSRHLVPVMVSQIDFNQVTSDIALTQVLNYTDLESSVALPKLVSALNKFQIPAPLPIPLPAVPAAPIHLLSTVLDKITDFSIFLTPQQQKDLLETTRKFLYKPKTRRNARYVLERFRKRADHDLVASVADEIDALLELSANDSTPPPIPLVTPGPMQLPIINEHASVPDLSTNMPVPAPNSQVVSESTQPIAVIRIFGSRIAVGATLLLLAIGSGGFVLSRLGRQTPSATPTITAFATPIAHIDTPTTKAGLPPTTPTATPTATFSKTTIPSTVTPTFTAVPPTKIPISTDTLIPSDTPPASFSSTPILSTSAQLRLQAGTTDLQTGQSYDVKVHIDNITDLWLADLEIQYDPTLVYVFGTKAGSPMRQDQFLTPGSTTTVRNSVEGNKVVYTVSLVVPASPVSGNGDIAMFKIYPLAPGATQITFSKASLLKVNFATDESGQRAGTGSQAIPFTHVLVKFNITGKKVDPPQEATATPTLTNDPKLPIATVVDTAMKTVVPTDTPIIMPADAVTANIQWKPQFQNFNGVTMAKVPSGCFMMGSNDGPDNERPVTKVCFVQPFWIDRTEVTWAQFKQFGGRIDMKQYFVGDNRPVDRVTWFEARDFCAKQRGSRLPTEAEWEYAVRGPDDLVYPWGNTFDNSKVVYNRSTGFGPANVGSIPSGASWVGSLDMSGNVSEWTSSIYEPYPKSLDDERESNSNISIQRVLRGGLWYGTDTNILRASFREGSLPTMVFEAGDIGFRCTRS